MDIPVKVSSWWFQPRSISYSAADVPHHNGKQPGNQTARASATSCLSSAAWTSAWVAAWLEAKVWSNTFLSTGPSKKDRGNTHLGTLGILNGMSKSVTKTSCLSRSGADRTYVVFQNSTSARFASWNVCLAARRHVGCGSLPVTSACNNPKSTPEKYKSKWVHPPQVGMKIKNVWVATIQVYVKVMFQSHHPPKKKRAGDVMCIVVNPLEKTREGDWLPTIWAQDFGWFLFEAFFWSLKKSQKWMQVS